jgi:hypothetical protein
MLPTHRPPTHPGEVLLKEFLEPLGVSQVEGAPAQGACPSALTPPWRLSWHGGSGRGGPSWEPRSSPSASSRRSESSRRRHSCSVPRSGCCEPCAWATRSAHCAASASTWPRASAPRRTSMPTPNCPGSSASRGGWRVGRRVAAVVIHDRRGARVEQRQAYRPHGQRRLEECAPLRQIVEICQARQPAMGLNRGEHQTVTEVSPAKPGVAPSGARTQNPRTREPESPRTREPQNLLPARPQRLCQPRPDAGWDGRGHLGTPERSVF